MGLAAGQGGTLTTPGQGGTLTTPGQGGTLTIPGQGGTLTIPGQGGTLTIPGQGGTLGPTQGNNSLITPPSIAFLNNSGINSEPGSVSGRSGPPFQLSLILE